MARNPDNLVPITFKGPPAWDEHLHYAHQNMSVSRGELLRGFLRRKGFPEWIKKLAEGSGSAVRISADAGSYTKRRRVRSAGRKKR